MAEVVTRSLYWGFREDAREDGQSTLHVEGPRLTPEEIQDWARSFEQTGDAKVILLEVPAKVLRDEVVPKPEQARPNG
jgi:hypothetical protein